LAARETLLFETDGLAVTRLEQEPMHTVLRIARPENVGLEKLQVISAGQQLIRRDSQIDVHLVYGQIEFSRPGTLYLDGFRQGLTDIVRGITDLDVMTGDVRRQPVGVDVAAIGEVDG